MTSGHLSYTYFKFDKKKTNKKTTTYQQLLHMRYTHFYISVVCRTLVVLLAQNEKKKYKVESLNGKLVYILYSIYNIYILSGQHGVTSVFE